MSDTVKSLITECLSQCYNLTELRNLCLSLEIRPELVFGRSEGLTEAAHKLIFFARRTKKLSRLANLVVRRGTTHPLIEQLSRAILEIRREQVLVCCTSNLTCLKEVERTVRAFGSEVDGHRGSNEEHADYLARIIRRIKRSSAHIGIIGDGEIATTGPADEHFELVYTHVKVTSNESWLLVPASAQRGRFAWIVQGHPAEFIKEYRDALDLLTKLRTCIDDVRLRLD